MYAVVKQPTSVNKGLVTAKARLAKQGLTIPRRELVLGHMAVNLLSNVQDALQGFPYPPYTVGSIAASHYTGYAGMETSSNSWQIVSERLESMVTLRGDT